MLERKKSARESRLAPRWLWTVTGALFLAMAVACFTDFTLTVQADAPLARPASTLPPPPPPASVLAVPRPAPKALAAEALRGIASWYGSVLDGHHTANGELFDMEAMTAAHKTLPFGTVLRVVNLRNRKSVVVRVNDRGILTKDRVIDLSYAAADELGIIKTGVAPVRLEVLALGHPQVQNP
jgi:rare lipoprotein A